MRKQFYILIALLILTVSAAAHPLGNFSVNQYSRLEVAASQIKLRQVLELAEIPTLQAEAAMDAGRDAARSGAE